MRLTVCRAMLSMVLAATLTALVMPTGATAEEDTRKVSVNDLINRMEEFDGRPVVIEGEVVGDIMRRGDHAWITVNDDAYSERSIEEGGGFAGYSNIGIGVWAESWQTDRLEHLGSYRTKGDRVRVEGVFHRVCQEHGGDTDIHALRVEMLEEGYEIKRPFNYARLLAALALLAVCAWLWWLRARRIRAAVSERE